MYFMGPAGGVKIDINMININVLYGEISSCVKIESGEILLDLKLPAVDNLNERDTGLTKGTKPNTQFVLYGQSSSWCENRKWRNIARPHRSSFF